MNDLKWAELERIARSNSLTQSLKELALKAGVEFSVNVEFVGVEEQSGLFARTVWLCLGNRAVVWAKSTCKPQSNWQEILNCGIKPLGEILFSGKLDNLKRSPIHIQTQSAQSELIIRQSTFEYQGEQLDLVEEFLPAIWDFLG